jgi:hypothetical protein
MDRLASPVVGKRVHKEKATSVLGVTGRRGQSGCGAGGVRDDDPDSLVTGPSDGGADRGRIGVLHRVGDQFRDDLFGYFDQVR